MSNIVYGVINENGGIDVNSGQIATAERTGTGRYTVKFAFKTFSTPPVVTATVMTEGTDDTKGTNRTISLVSVSETEFTLAVRKASSGNEMSDRPFSFHAIQN